MDMLKLAGRRPAIKRTLSSAMLDTNLLLLLLQLLLLLLHYYHYYYS